MTKHSKWNWCDNVDITLLYLSYSFQSFYLIVTLCLWLLPVHWMFTLMSNYCQLVTRAVYLLNYNGSGGRKLFWRVHAILHQSEVQRSYLHRLHCEPWAQDRTAQRWTSQRGCQENQWKGAMVSSTAYVLYYTMYYKHKLTDNVSFFSLGRWSSLYMAFPLILLL